MTTTSTSTDLPYDDGDLEEGEALPGEEPRRGGSSSGGNSSGHQYRQAGGYHDDQDDHDDHDHGYGHGYNDRHGHGRYDQYDGDFYDERSMEMGGRGRNRDHNTGSYTAWRNDRQSGQYPRHQPHQHYQHNHHHQNHNHPGDGGQQGRGRDRLDWDAPSSRPDTRGGSRSANSWSSSRSRSPSTRSRSRSGYATRSRSRSPRSFPGPGYATSTVIVEGLPTGVPLSELQKALYESRQLADFPDVEIRLPQTNGQRRAFIQFPSIHQASGFVKANYPQMLVRLGESTDQFPDGQMVVYIHYARRTDDNELSSGPNWNCPLCDFSNYATRAVCKECKTPQPSTSTTAAPSSTRPHLTGESDAAPGTVVPTQILVVYPVAPDLGEAGLAAELRQLEMESKLESKENSSSRMLKSTAPSGNTSRLGGRPGSLHRVFVVRDRDSGDALRYGFAEFWTAQDAAAALEKYTKAPASFAVAGTAVTVAATHTGVFIPEQARPAPEEEEGEKEDGLFSFSPLFNPSLRVRYWEPTVYARGHVVAAESPDAATTATGQTQGQTRGQTQEADAAADAQKGPGRDGKKSKKRKADGGPPSASSSSTKRPAMIGQMNMWQKKAAELRTDNGGTPPAPAIRISLSADAALAVAGGAAVGTRQQQKQSTPAADPAADPASDQPHTSQISFVDKERLSCLLCMMKYKSIDDVAKHERSRNHKTALEDPEKVKAATQRVAKQAAHKTDDVSVGREEETSQQGQYRDRAKERREAYNQPNRPALIKPAKSAQSQSRSSQPQPQPQPQPALSAAPPPTSIPAVPSTSTTTTTTATSASSTTTATAPPHKPSKGSAMLAKMGWTAGTGLGASGAGRTTVIETHAYQEGVGLGAEGGNLGDAAAVAESRTRGSYADYVSSVQDRARARYNQIS